jgi:hypothetical protein
LDVRLCHKKLDLFFAIWNQGNHGTLFLFNTHKCQETQIKNPFDSILNCGLIKDFWKWTFVIKKGHFYKGLSKDSYNRNKFMVKIWDNNNLLYTLKKIHNFKKLEF